MKKLSLILLVCFLATGVFVISGCTSKPDTGDTTREEMEFTERNQKRLRKARPEPKMDDSLERANLIKYLEYWNNSNRESYIYLLSRSGTVLAHYVIKGKVTYCSSKLTTRDQIVHTRWFGTEFANIIESPGLDGSYGPSEDAIFFFTVENPDVPVIWKGDYLVSGVPLKLTTQPVLVRTINDE